MLPWVALHITASAACFLLPLSLQMIGGFQSDLGSVLAGMRSATSDIQRLVGSGVVACALMHLQFVLTCSAGLWPWRRACKKQLQHVAGPPPTVVVRTPHLPPRCWTRCSSCRTTGSRAWTNTMWRE